MIRHLTYQQIDQQAWDACIREADNGLLYASSIYLNSMAGYWEALIMDDYKAVMPLTIRSKYGIRYLYQPFFVPCLGVFGKAISAQLVTAFLNAVPSGIRYWEISLNHGNRFQLNEYNLQERTNFILPLQDSYEQLYARFRENIQRNIKKAAKLGCYSKKNIPVADVIQLAKAQSVHFAPITDTDYQNFVRLYEQLAERGQAISYGIYSSTHQLVASCVFFLDEKRAYYILVGNYPNGKTLGASHALINAFIKEYAGSNLLLDFEGSDIRNLAFFYSSFGAVEERYASLKINRLPFWLRWLKK